MTERIVLEVAPKRSFASALDWPGWSRSGQTEADAVEALLAYAPRYSRVVAETGLAFDVPADVASLDVVERLKGGAGTEFGAPGAIAAAEHAPVEAGADLDRLIAILRAAWAAFGASAKGAEGVELTKGPRGGGRELAKIIGHAREAEAAYLGQLGSRPPPAEDESADAPMAVLRAAFIETMRAVVTGAELPNPRRTKRPWPARYAVRRTAWHVLDHAWEIEDRSAGQH
ncbi:MAG: hypothetical protein ACR2K4_10870 [Candidatus Limnocylindria bacterium]